MFVKYSPVAQLVERLPVIRKLAALGSNSEWKIGLIVGKPVDRKVMVIRSQACRLRRLEGSETIRLTSLWEDEIVQASSKVEGTCKEDVRGSSPRGGANFFRHDFILITERV